MYCYNCMSKIADGSVKCPFCGMAASVQNAEHQLVCGTVLNGKYLVGQAIGEGGFGITYIGLDLNLELKIAIKEFYPNGYANRSSTVKNYVTFINNAQGRYFNDSKKQFLREAKSLAKFSSEKGIVDVRDYFNENNTTYIVMEYIEGGTLASRVKNKGVFRYDEIFRLMLPIMYALKKMHAEGIIHRDISPDNIMFANDNSLKLMDFGAARYYTGAEKKTMSVMLKHGFTPYEQHSSTGNQGPWTDVYALCATMYKCITGKTPVDCLNRVMKDTLKTPGELGIDMPEQCQNILLYGMAIYPDNRCRSMTELIELIEDALNGQELTVSLGSNSQIENEIAQTTENDRIYKSKVSHMGRSVRGFDNMVVPVNYNNRTVSPDAPTSVGVPDMPPVTPNTRYGAYAQNQYVQQNVPNTNQFVSDEPPKSNKGLIAVIVIVASVLVIGIIAAIAILLASNNSGGGFNLFGATETTAAPTTEPTTDPTTEPVIRVPNIEGQKSSDAYNAISELGLKYKAEFEYSDDVPEDYVISQSPEEDTKAQKGDTVTFVISRGKKPSDPTQPPTKKVDPTDPPQTSSSTSHPDNGNDPTTQDRYNLRTASRYISKSDISWMSAEEIQWAINEIYARHGYTFKKEPSKSYFESKTWYSPNTTSMDVVISRLNTYENENLKIMGAYRDSFKN